MNLFEDSGTYFKAPETCLFVDNLSAFQTFPCVSRVSCMAWCHLLLDRLEILAYYKLFVGRQCDFLSV